MYDKIGENYRQFSFTTSGYVEIIAFGEIQYGVVRIVHENGLLKPKTMNHLNHSLTDGYKGNEKLQSFKF
jgi:hypothetical protein